MTYQEFIEEYRKGPLYPQWSSEDVREKNCSLEECHKPCGPKENIEFIMGILFKVGTETWFTGPYRHSYGGINGYALHQAWLKWPERPAEETWEKPPEIMEKFFRWFTRINHETTKPDLGKPEAAGRRKNHAILHRRILE